MRLSVLGIGLVLVLYGCKAGQEAPLENRAHANIVTYYPVIVGEARYFLSVTHTPKGPVLATTIRKVTEERAVLGARAFLESVTHQRMDGDGGSLHAGRRFLILVKANAVLVADASKQDDPAWASELQAPVASGHAWRLLDADENTYCEVTGIEDVQLPRRELEGCARIQTYIRDGTTRVIVAEKWFAPRLGLVAETAYGPNGSVVGYSVYLGTTEPAIEDLRHWEAYVRKHPQGPAP